MPNKNLRNISCKTLYLKWQIGDYKMIGKIIQENPLIVDIIFRPYGGKMESSNQILNLRHNLDIYFKLYNRPGQSVGFISQNEVDDMKVDLL